MWKLAVKVETKPGRLPPVRLLALVLLALALSGCGAVFPQRMDPVVKIGLVAPFEGRHRRVGYDVIYSARMAVREMNQERGPGQAKVTLVAVDDFGDPEMALESAAAMAIDPDIVAVIGHWLPETSAVARSLYEEQGLPFLVAGEGAFGATDPADLSDSFLEAYAAVTPFDEVAGPYAGTAYDGVRLILAAIAETEDSGRVVDRSAVGQALEKVSYVGVTGTVRKQ